jgi:serine/threonine protein kinase
VTVAARVLNGRYALASSPVAGGAAVVYKASDLQSDMRHVAIKLFAESQAHTRLRAEFFGRECRALQELRHPSIIELLDWGTDETTGEAGGRRRDGGSE